MSGYEVEWCAGCPVVDGETNMDQADFRVEDFASHEEAEARARQLLPLDFFGAVGITKFEIVPLIPGRARPLTREYTSDREEISE